MKHSTFTYRPIRSHPAKLCLIYGLYAILCQLSFILLHALYVAPYISSDVLRHWFVPYLEYPLMSITLILVGSVLLELVSDPKAVT